MTRFTVFGTLALAALAIASCAPKEAEIDVPVVPGQEITIQATREGRVTKTALQRDGSTIWWTAGDELSLFAADATDGGAKFVKEGDDAEASAAFTGTLNVVLGSDSTTPVAPATKIWGIYPYDTRNALAAEVLTVPFKTVQTATPGSFDPQAMVSVACSENLSLKFFNAYGVLKFKVGQPNVKTVTLKCNDPEHKFYSTYPVSLERGFPVLGAGSGDSSEGITLASFTAAFDQDAYYYMVVPPHTFSGVTFELTYMDNSNVGTISSDAEFTVVRSNFHELTNPLVGEVGGNTEPGESADNPMTVEQAIAAVANLGTDETVGPYYVKGIVSSITQSYVASGNFGNATFTISDDGNSSSPQFTAYRLRYLDDTQYTSGTDVELGATVIIYSNLQLYKGNTPENKNGYLYSITPAPGFAITISDAIENGTVTASKTKAVEGVSITLTASPANGYEFDAWDVRTESGAPVTVTNDAFLMPAENVIVSATFTASSTVVAGYLLPIIDDLNWVPITSGDSSSKENAENIKDNNDTSYVAVATNYYKGRNRSIKLGTSSVVGGFVTKTLDLSNAFDVVITAKRYSATKDSRIIITVDDGSTTAQDWTIDLPSTDDNAFAEFRHSFAAATVASTITLTTVSVGDPRAYFNAFAVVPANFSFAPVITVSDPEAVLGSTNSLDVPFSLSHGTGVTVSAAVAADAQSWITAASVSGTTVKLTLTTNSTGSSRRGIVTLSAPGATDKTFTVIQNSITLGTAAINGTKPGSTDCVVSTSFTDNDSDVSKYGLAWRVKESNEAFTTHEEDAAFTSYTVSSLTAGTDYEVKAYLLLSDDSVIESGLSYFTTLSAGAKSWHAETWSKLSKSYKTSYATGEWTTEGDWGTWTANGCMTNADEYASFEYGCITMGKYADNNSSGPTLQSPVIAGGFSKLKYSYYANGASYTWLIQVFAENEKGESVEVYNSGDVHAKTKNALETSDEIEITGATKNAYILITRTSDNRRVSIGDFSIYY
ncbi:MAG: hypothetical protein J5759_05435 [Bacteroidales bacterium]|nr:hypothetical protein [Bacteroidales bacterium]